MITKKTVPGEQPYKGLSYEIKGNVIIMVKIIKYKIFRCGLLCFYTAVILINLPPIYHLHVLKITSHRVQSYPTLRGGIRPSAVSVPAQSWARVIRLFA